MQWQQETYTVSDDPAQLDLRAICSLLHGTYWGASRTPAVIATSLKHSLCFGLYHQGQQVGIARVVTDRATVGYLCDVVISDAHQRKGLGKWMLSCILDHPELQGCRIDLFTRDAQEFYREFGFGPHRFTSMVRYPPEAKPDQT
jgi:GNAT superfamily N-acetyltransferase